MDSQDAKDALDQISLTKKAISERSKAPKGYYAFLGFLIGLDIFAIPLPLPWKLLLIAVATAGIGAAVGWYRQTVGTWARGNLSGRDAWAYWVLAIVDLVALVVVMIVGLTNGPWFPISIIAGVAAFVATSVLGPVWDRAYQQQVRDH